MIGSVRVNPKLRRRNPKLNHTSMIFKCHRSYFVVFRQTPAIQLLVLSKSQMSSCSNGRVGEEVAGLSSSEEEGDLFSGTGHG